MKKHTFNTSIIAVLCVFCATAAGAAGSVRALGGTGTFNGTTAAATRGTSAARAGSLRISPSTTRTVSAGTRTNANGTTTPTERLSIGKYLGGATSVSTTGGSSSGGSSSGGTEPESATGDHDEFKANIATLFGNVQTIDGEITALENSLAGKQNTLSAGDYIDIENDEVSLDLTSLESYLADNLPFADQGVNVQYDGSRWLKYSTDNGATWTPFLDLNGLSGDYVDETELNAAIGTALDNYYTKDEVDSAIQNAIDGISLPEQVQPNWNATSGMGMILNKPDLSQYATTEALAGKQNAISDLETIRSGAAAGATAVQPAALTDALAGKQDAISDLETIRSGAAAGATAVQPAALGAYPTTEQMNAAIEQAQLDGEVDLSGYATTAAMNEALAGKQEAISDLETIRSGAAAGATAVQPSALEGYATTSDLSGYATTEALNGKQPALTDDQLAAVNSGVTSTTVAQVEANKSAIAIQDAALTTINETLAGKQATIDSEHPLSYELVDGLATVAHTGDYADLSNKPTIPAAQVNADWNATEGVAQILNKPSVYTQSETDTLLNAKANADDVYAKSETYSKTEVDNALEAVSGDVGSIGTQISTALDDYTTTTLQPNYALKSELPTIDSALSDTSTNPVQNKAITVELGGKITKGTVPSPGQYVLGFVDGVQTYIKIVDANGD